MAKTLYDILTVEQAVAVLLCVYCNVSPSEAAQRAALFVSINYKHKEYFKMRRTIAVFLSAVAIFAVELFTNGQQAFAGECEKYKYTAPVGVSILTKEEVLARVADHTEVARNYKIYFGQDGTLVFYQNFEAWHGNWYSCGPVVVFRWFNPEHNAERLLAMQAEGQITFYALDSEYLGTYVLKEGKEF